jgi:hypothetical protein
MEVSGQLHAQAILRPAKELGGPQSRVWSLQRREKSLVPTGNRAPVVQPGVRRYTD